MAIVGFREIVREKNTGRLRFRLTSVIRNICFDRIYRTGNITELWLVFTQSERDLVCPTNFWKLRNEYLPNYFI